MCGVSKDHLDRVLPLTRSILLFHIYYQTKQILAELEVKLPDDEGFNPVDNPYNKGVLKMIKNEFNYNPPRGADIFIDQNSRGAGHPYNYINGYSKLRGGYDPNAATFTSYKDPNRVHIDFLKQDPFDFTRSIADKTDGFTSAGVRRIDDSIRSYVYCILGAQVQTRANILGEDGPQLDAQKQFLVLIEDCIKIGDNLQKSIANYQDACS